MVSKLDLAAPASFLSAEVFWQLAVASLKPTATIAHEGGTRFSRDSVEAQTLLRWIGAEAGDDGAVAPRLKSLRVFPPERIATPGALDQQLVVTAEFDDGTIRDVTRQCAYDVSDPTKVQVTESGVV
ncbi:MAG: hypothetical protein ACLPIX_00430, partial [Rhodomicrobium sp.]